MNVYCDNASTTKISPEVLAAMEECSEHYGNPSCIHSMGQKSKELINIARSQIAKSINAKSNEIIFTSGGTEANNLAIQGYVLANSGKGYHIITSKIEHASVLNPVEHLYQEGYDVTYLPVDSSGRVNIQHLRHAIRRNTILVSVMFANNEIGTIQPIKEIGNICKQYNICFHTDAIQAFGHCDIDVNSLNIDIMSLSGHKIYAPKGIGALYINNDVNIMPLFFGGGQEYHLRSGTENVNSIVGMGKAVEILSDRDTYWSNSIGLKTKLIDGIKSNIPGVTFNGSADNSLPHIVNVSFEGVEGVTLTTMLDARGIYVSNGSACTSNSLESSHVLDAIGVPDKLATGSLRFSFGRYNTEDDVEYILEVLPDLIKQLRKGPF